MKTTVKILGPLMAVLIAVATASAEMSIPTTTTDVFSQMGWLQVGAENTWRGIDRGDVGFRMGGALSWGEPDAHRLNFIASSEFRTAAADRSGVSDLMRAGMAMFYRLNTEGSKLWLAGDAFVLPSVDRRAATAEVAAGADFKMPVWLPERLPMVMLEARHDLVRYRADYLRAAARFDYKFAVKYSAMLEVGHAWSSIPSGDVIGSSGFGSQGTDLTLSLLRQCNPAEGCGWWPSSVEPFVRMIWDRRNSDANLIDGGLRMVLLK